LPAKIVDGALFVTLRSAVADVVTVAVDELSLAFSVTSPEIVAVFEIVEPAAIDEFTPTTSVNVPLAPGASDGFEQLTVPFVVQLQPAGAAIDVNVVPAGRMSVITTLGALLGPEALKVMV